MPTDESLDCHPGFLCLIGLWHWKHRGTRSEVIGDVKKGLILLPATRVASGS